MEKNVNNILSLTEELKELIIDTDEYKKYIYYKNKIDNNKELKRVILLIKAKQKVIVNKESKKQNIDKEEFELENLFNQLKNNNDYCNYIKYARKLNDIITKIQKRFEEYFNTFTLD
jgi:cell fate (sporulation/competence/biofilm development) regulator YlbF (YheA/YmcA/DUF963 family)